ncbi:MAG TPA: hypothetical protein VG096_06570 [Bryobacteraceae bacterium]|jgi:hypothetical protein|nr:hypothetical protein [Bryobacteraceae bacterium]
MKHETTTVDETVKMDGYLRSDSDTRTSVEQRVARVDTDIRRTRSVMASPAA